MSIDSATFRGSDTRYPYYANIPYLQVRVLAGAASIMGTTTAVEISRQHYTGFPQNTAEAAKR